MIFTRKLRSAVWLMVSDALPVDGTAGTGAGRAGPGSLVVYIGATPHLYINTNTKASPTWKLATRTVSVVAAGAAAAGAVTATGAKVGDVVATVFNHTDGTNGASSFETVVTVADQIQQSSASNLTTKTFLFQFQR